MSWIPVALFSQRTEAEPIQRLLEQAGFTTKVCHEDWLRNFWFVSKGAAGVSLEVPAEQFERAELFVTNLDETSDALQEAIRCPECRSLRVAYPQFTRHSLLTNLTLGVAAEVGLVEKDYYCEQCHYTWPKEGTRPRRDRQHMAPYYFIEGVEQTTREPLPRPQEQRKAA